MNIPARKEIKEVLTQVANENGYSGAAVDVIISLMSTGYYETILRSIGLTQELRSETAVGINSMIALAGSRMYSVYRGSNKRLILIGVASEYRELHRGDVIYESEDYNLYVEVGVNLVPNQYNIIYLIMSSEYLDEDVINGPIRFYTEFRYDDISEDYKLWYYKDQGEEYLANTTKVFTEYANSLNDSMEYNLNTPSGAPLFFDLTIPGFGVRFYSKSKFDQLGTTSANSGNDYNYNLSAFKYLDQEDLGDLTYDDLDLPEIVFDDSSQLPILITNATLGLDNSGNITIDESTIDYLEKGDGNPDRLVGNILEGVTDSLRNNFGTNFHFGIYPREDLESIKFNYNLQINSIYSIRSRSDLVDAYLLRFSEYVENVAIGFTEVHSDPYRPTESNLTRYLLHFYYIAKDNLPFDFNAAFERWYDEVKSYYIIDNAVQEPATEVGLYVTCSIRSSNPTLSESDINSLVSQYLKKFNTVLSATELSTSIAKLDSVTELVNFTVDVRFPGADKETVTSTLDLTYDPSSGKCYYLSLKDLTINTL